MSAPAIPQAVLEKQTAASNPAMSVFVTAHAGSGKTHVLAQRVIRLLLRGCDPNCILCLTFTKAAAANMAKRVFDELARWTTLDDAALDRAIRAVDGTPDAATRRRARRLFAEALETPGGLKVQTIHAFCTRLLHQFPFEANVAAGFTVLEERAEAEMIDALRLDVLLEAAADTESTLGRALSVAVVAAAEQTFGDLVREAIARRDLIMNWLDHAGSDPAVAAAELSHILGIDPADTMEKVEADLFTSPHLPMAEWPAIMAALEAGSKSDRDHVARFETARSGFGTARVDAYIQVFCTGSLDRRTNILTKKLQNEHPDLFTRMQAEQDRVCDLLDRRRAVNTRERSIALVTIAGEVIRRYRDEKQRRGLLDYSDLIDKTLALFNRGAAAWVLYKLDRGINHLLIDEAQDTSPKQWAVIRNIVGEFLAGEGARGELKRTIFAVGDEKQSIFSFQGAEPHLFHERLIEFERRHAPGTFARTTLDHSFRSSAVILDAVDTVFKRPEAHRGLTADPVETVHRAVRDTAPGLVEVWDVVKPDDKDEIEGWDAPFDTQSETSPSVKLARKIAKSVAAWIARGEKVGDGERRRAARPGDILVLVRQRGALFEAIIRALKDARIDVAGADRLVLTEHIAVMDLMVLADALLLPADDLALATVLRSPLFNLSEDDLFALAWNRPGSLRASLHSKAPDNPAFAAANATLDRWAAQARRDTPFAFYAHILGAEGGRARILARLGPEAADALDEFLNLALDYEMRETPSLHGFLARLRATATEVKRDMEIARDEVRVMTVHGAKGLEAPIVILADTTTKPSGPREPRLLALPRQHAVQGTPDCVVWARAMKTDTPPVAEARQRARTAAEDEHRRLLYVAMTRAADWLIVCGAEGKQQRPAGCWYDLVSDALRPAASETLDADGAKVWRLQKFAPAQSELPLGEGAAPAQAETLPGWLRTPAPTETAPAIVITPSAAIESEKRPMPAAASADRERALLHGTILHRLMQSLPDIAAERREAAARRYLKSMAAQVGEAECERLLARVMTLLADPRFAALAGPTSRAEVPIVGRLRRDGGAPLLVSGQVDRLAITGEAVLIADYKTNRPAPRKFAEVPESYVAQLALYRAVLTKLYPGRSVSAALIWTEVPDFMEIPSAALDAALATVIAG